MGQPIELTFASGIFAGYCFVSFEKLALDIVSGIAGEVSGSASFINYGNTTPPPDDRTKPWFRTNADGTPDDTYTFVNGAWVAKHHLLPGAVILYRGSEASIETYDGGEAGAITATTGPMWQKLSTMDGRFPLGPGTLNGVAVAVGTQGGAATVTLVEENLPVHDIQGYAVDEGANLSSNALISDDDRTTNANTADSFGGETDGSTRPTVIIPPYTAIFFIERTARTHKRL